MENDNEVMPLWAIDLGALPQGSSALFQLFIFSIDPLACCSNRSNHIYLLTKCCRTNLVVFLHQIFQYWCIIGT